MERNDALAAVLGAAIDAVSDPDIESPAARVRSALRMVGEMPIHVAHHDKVAALVCEFQRVAVELLRTMNYSDLARERDKFLQAIRFGGFTVAPPAPTQRDLWQAHIVRLWKGPEVDELWQVLRANEQIISVSWHEAVAMNAAGEKRALTREALRLRSRPSYSDKSPEAWIAMLGPAIREPESERAAI